MINYNMSLGEIIGKYSLDDTLAKIVASETIEDVCKTPEIAESAPTELASVRVTTARFIFEFTPIGTPDGACTVNVYRTIDDRDPLPTVPYITVSKVSQLLPGQYLMVEFLGKPDAFKILEVDKEYYGTGCARRNIHETHSIGIEDVDTIRVDTGDGYTFYFERILTFENGMGTTTFRNVKHTMDDPDVEPVSLEEAKNWRVGEILKLHTSNGQHYSPITFIKFMKPTKGGE